MPVRHAVFPAGTRCDLDFCHGKNDNPANASPMTLNSPLLYEVTTVNIPVDQEKAVDALVGMMAALTIIRLYPPTSDLVGRSMEKIHPVLAELLENTGSLTVAESENSLLINAQPVGEKDRKKPQLSAFLQLMQTFGIKSFTFDKGIQKEEIIDLLNILCKKPEDIQSDGGIRRLFVKGNMPHIHMDEKVFVAVGSAGNVPRKMEIREEDILRYLTGETTPGSVDASQAAEMAENPERLVRAFSTGLSSMTEKNEPISRRKRSEKFGSMIRNIDGISKKTGDADILSQVGDAVTRVDGDTLSTMVSDNLEPLLTAGLFDRIVPGLTDEQFKRLAVKLRFLQNRAGVTTPGTGGRNPELVDRALARLMDSEKAERLKAGIAEKYELELALKKNLSVKLKAGLSSIMKGEKYCFMDDQVMQSIPDTVASLHGKGKNRTAQHLIGRLCDGLDDEDTDIAVAASRALAVIHADIAPLTGSSLERFNAFEKGNRDREPFPDVPPCKTVSDHFDAVEQYLRKDDTAGAVDYLFDRIVGYTGDNRFREAEALREKLLDVDPMALDKIVKSGEIIEAKKTEAVDGSFRELWRELNAELSPEEINTLYFSLEEAGFDSDHPLFEQGKFNAALFFITRGQMRLSCRQGDREILITRLSAGDTAGADTFFDYTVCTTSLLTLTPAGAYILKKSATEQWEQKAPGLPAKIRDYCARHAPGAEMLNAKGINRRAYDRRELSGDVSVRVLSGKNTPTGKPFKGYLSDISAGGLSFSIRSSRTETARLLLGRKLHLQFSLPGTRSETAAKKTGTAIGVKYQLNNEYSVHVKFDRPIGGKVSG